MFARASPCKLDDIDNPRVDVNAAGTAFLVWAESDTIYAAKYDGAWGAAAPISSDPDVENPDVAVAADGLYGEFWDMW